VMEPDLCEEEVVSGAEEQERCEEVVEEQG
jgi:hypothetical protein